MEIGKEFDAIVNKEVLDNISRAMISLHNELIYTDKETCKEVFNEKVKELRKTVNLYIDNQLTVFENLH